MTKVFSAPRMALIASAFLSACAVPDGGAVMVEPMVAETSADMAPSSKISPVIAPVPMPLPPSRNPGRARRGVITAGDIDDAHTVLKLGEGLAVEQVPGLLSE